MTNVTVNGFTAVHAGSNGTLTTSDTCLIPPFCVPYPFTNIAKSQDAAMTATSVTINGNPACIMTSNFAVSNGDTPGACGGIVSGTVNGMAEFITCSNNVFIEGVPVVRQMDKMVSNNKNTSPMPLLQPGAAKPPEISDEGPNELDEADLPYEVDIHVVGNELNSLKSIIGVVDLDLAPEEEEGEAATLEPSNSQSSSSQNSTSGTKSNTVPLKRKLLVKSVKGPTSANLGDNVIYTVTKTSLADATPEELKHVSWQIKSNKGNVLQEYKKHGPKLELKIDKKLQSETFYVMPYINSPIKKVSITTQVGNTSSINTLSEKGAKFIRTREGIKLDKKDPSKVILYNDSAGHATIGYGHLVHKGPINGSESKEFKDGITIARAMELFATDAKKYENLVNSRVKVKLSQNQFDALVSFAFNIPKGMNPKKSTLLKNLNKGDYAGVPTQLNRWHKETIFEKVTDLKTGKVTRIAKLVPNKGLLKRRNKEGDLFKNGVY